MPRNLFAQTGSCINSCNPPWRVINQSSGGDVFVFMFTLTMMETMYFKYFGVTYSGKQHLLKLRELNMSVTRIKRIVPKCCVFVLESSHLLAMQTECCSGCWRARGAGPTGAALHIIFKSWRFPSQTQLEDAWGITSSVPGCFSAASARAIRHELGEHQCERTCADSETH